jgi:hypothetical protein
MVPSESVCVASATPNGTRTRVSDTLAKTDWYILRFDARRLIIL